MLFSKNLCKIAFLGAVIAVSIAQQQFNDAQGFQQSAGSSASSSVGFYKVDQCMLTLEASVCDPDCVLSQAEADRINEDLMKLQRGTQTNGRSSLSTFGGECPPNGLALKILIFKDLADPENTDQKIRDLHWRWTMAHPCDRTAVIMLSPGPDYRNQYPNRNMDYYASFPAGVWSKFYAISSKNAGIEPSELVRLYRNSVYSVRRGEYVEALENIINLIRDRITN